MSNMTNLTNMSKLTHLMSISISLHMGHDWTFSLHGLHVTCPFLHCMMGGKDIRAQTYNKEIKSRYLDLQLKLTGHSRFCFRSSGRTRLVGVRSSLMLLTV